MRSARCSDAAHALRSVRRPARPRAQEYDTSPHPVNPFSKRHYLFWGFINLLPLALAPAARTHFGLLGTMFLFASTIKGYLYGVALPRPLKMVVHPLIMCCLYTSGCVGLWAYLTNVPYLDILQLYMPTVRRPACASASRGAAAMRAARSSAGCWMRNRSRLGQRRVHCLRLVR